MGYLFTFLVSCCSIDGEKPNRCCLLPNKVENIDRGQVWAWPSMTPKASRSAGDPGPIKYTVLWPHVSSYLNYGTSIGSSVSVGLTVVSNRQTRADTHTPRYVSNSRPLLCTACVRCGLIIITERAIHTTSDCSSS